MVFWRVKEIAFLAGVSAACLLCANQGVAGQPLIIDHEDTDITQLTEAEINRAKQVLRIGYGHTSHGSQLTDGMDGLVNFANNGGLGMSYSNNIFEWNNGGTGGALDLEEGDGYGTGWLDHDCGYWPNWYDETIEFLDDPSHSDVNVIIWSWCGQMDDKYSAGTLTNEYLAPMSMLETSYPDVVFVYMTGHTEIGDDADNKAACQAIRNYCIENNKVLYDFNHIEHYDPDGTYFEYVDDDCDYYAGPGTGYQGNWATEWQNSHTQGVDWYNCGAAHSEPLNANQKAYAAWHLWCALAEDLDRDGLSDPWEEQYGTPETFGDGTNDCDGDGVTDYEEYVADTNPTNPASWFCITNLALSGSCSIAFHSSADRAYSLECADNLVTGRWMAVSGQTNQAGPGGRMTLTDPSDPESRFYRVKVALP